MRCLSAKVVDQPAVREAIKISREFCSDRVGAPRADDVCPSVLEQLVGDGGIRAQPHDVAVPSPAVTPVEDIERAPASHVLLLARDTACGLKDAAAAGQAIIRNASLN